MKMMQLQFWAILEKRMENWDFSSIIPYSSTTYYFQVTWKCYHQYFFNWVLVIHIEIWQSIGTYLGSRIHAEWENLKLQFHTACLPPCHQWLLIFHLEAPWHFSTWTSIKFLSFFPLLKALRSCTRDTRWKRLNLARMNKKCHFLPIVSRFHATR